MKNRYENPEESTKDYIIQLSTARTKLIESFQDILLDGSWDAAGSIGQELYAIALDIDKLINFFVTHPLVGGKLKYDDLGFRVGNSSLFGFSDGLNFLRSLLRINHTDSRLKGFIEHWYEGGREQYVAWVKKQFISDPLLPFMKLLKEKEVLKNDDEVSIVEKGIVDIIGAEYLLEAQHKNEALEWPPKGEVDKAMEEIAQATKKRPDQGKL